VTTLEDMLDEKVLSKPWHEVDALVAQKFDELVSDLADLNEEEKDIKGRIEKMRALLAESIKPLGHAVDVTVDREKKETLSVRVRWQPDSPTEKLDRGKLVQAGVTPDQLKLGTVVGTRKGFLRVDTIKGA